MEDRTWIPCSRSRLWTERWPRQKGGRRRHVLAIDPGALDYGKWHGSHLEVLIIPLTGTPYTPRSAAGPRIIDEALEFSERRPSVCLLSNVHSLQKATLDEPDGYAHAYAVLARGH